MFLELNSKGLYQSSGKEKKVVVLFPSSTKREFRHFHVVVGQRRQRNVQKSVMHVQSCCFANQTYCFFAVLVAVRVVVAYAEIYFCSYHVMLESKNNPHRSPFSLSTLICK